MGDIVGHVGDTSVGLFCYQNIHEMILNSLFPSLFGVGKCYFNVFFREHL